MKLAYRVAYCILKSQFIVTVMPSLYSCRRSCGELVHVCALSLPKPCCFPEEFQLIGQILVLSRAVSMELPKVCCVGFQRLSLLIKGLFISTSGSIKVFLMEIVGSGSIKGMLVVSLLRSLLVSA